MPFDYKKGYSLIGVVSSGENSIIKFNGATVDIPLEIPFAILGPGPNYIYLKDSMAADKLYLLPLKYNS